MEPQSLHKRPNPMINASLALGVCSLLFFLNVYLSLIFSSLGIMFALLSRGSSLRLSEKAVGCLSVSLTSLVLLLILVIGSTCIVISLFGLETAMDPKALQDAMMNWLETYMNAAGGNAL